MKKQVNIFVYWRTERYRDGGGRFSFSEYEGMESVDASYIPVGSVDVEFDLPEGFDPRALLVESLVKQKAVIIREATEKAEALEEQIQQLLALPQEVAA